MIHLETSVENIPKSENGLENILNICVSALDNFARREKKYSRGNNMALMNQTLKKIQIKRGRLRNSYGQ